MTKISLTAVYHISAYLARIVTLLLICSVNALAKNNCESNASAINPVVLGQSGIGGTGIHGSKTVSDSGIGGTGIYDGGVGGTGDQASGIGGTGSVASDSGIGGTGVVGTITGFASICVNGVEIHYDDNTPISVDGRPSTVRDLALGQVVAVRTIGTDRELTARNIAVIHAAVGPISSLNVETREVQVLGQTIQIGQSRDHDHFSSLRAGDWVQVSGHRLAGGTIVASRIESIQPLAEARIVGHVTHVDASGFEVNGARVEHGVQQSLPTNLTQGMEVRVAGHWDGAHLQAQHIQTEPTRQSIGNVEHMVIEGYVHTFNDKEVNLSNRAITLDSDVQMAPGHTRGDLRQDQRIQVSGRLGADQRIIAEHIELKHESPVQLLERYERNQTNGGGKDKKNHPENEPTKENDGGKNHNNGHSESSSKDSLKKEINVNPDKNHSPRESARSENASPARDNSEKKSNHAGSIEREHAEKAYEKRENPSDHKPIDKPEKPGESNLRDRPGDHRENSRDIDNHRDNLRDTDISDRVRDHSGHHDRHFDR
ncbi:hypothetical protein C8R34_106101 [Nitrosomonas sp. Nm84]|uniref:DUF5666 domain-containing protein n=1 Tax=Nitrosomonas sp. Nm84 TaxID=200124 RepID=UPI000D767A7E|nr:DUF5666 domain-containing protein [Nitrosomonas sp. Nm84]PXW88952.1 hypothetical protein C8R34_106101 [Nitrosomonas sp. Nm84]